MSWIDLLIIFLFVFFIVLDLKRGLVQSLASVVSFVVSLIVASLMYKSIYRFLVEKTGVYQWLQEFLSQRFSIGSNSGTLALDLEKLPKAIALILQELMESAGTAELNVLTSLTDMILYALCFLGIFLVVRIVIFVLAGLLDFVAKLPGLNILNKLGGLFMGFIEAAIVSLVVVNSAYTLSVLFRIESVINALNNSSIAQYFYIGYFFL